MSLKSFLDELETDAIPWVWEEIIDMDDDLNFGQIFAEVVFGYLEDEKKKEETGQRDIHNLPVRKVDFREGTFYLNFLTHARMCESAERVLKEMFREQGVANGLMSVLNAGRAPRSALRPGSSPVSKPITLVPGREQDIMERAYHTRCILKQIKNGWTRTVSFDKPTYTRAFSQLIGAVMNAEAGRESLDRKHVPFILELDATPNYVVEGAKGGNLVVRGNVGVLAIKHCEGGVFFIDGNAGRDFVDNSCGVDVFVRGNIEGIGQAYGKCNIHVEGKVINRGSVEELRENQPNVKVVEGDDYDKAYRCYFGSS